MAVTINGDGVVDVGGNASSAAKVRLYEDSDNGTNYIDLIAPASVASNRTITLPDETGTLLTTGSTFAGTGPAFYAYQLTAQTGVTQLTATKITFDAEVFDTNNNFASSRFTPTVAGYYQFSFGVSIPSANSGAFCQATIRKNNSTDTNGAASLGQSGTLYPQSVGSVLLYMNGSTDYVEVNIYGTAPGNYSILNGIYCTFFMGALVRAA
jgi:hypothetical protein